MSIVDVNITNIRILNRCSQRTRPTVDFNTNIDKSYVGCFTTWNCMFQFKKFCCCCCSWICQEITSLYYVAYRSCHL